MSRWSHTLLVLGMAAALVVSVNGHAKVAAVKNESAPTKQYILTDLKKMHANHSQCNSFYKELKDLTKEPFDLQFSAPSKASKKGEHAVRESSGMISNHTHSTVKQSGTGNLFHRVGMGNFLYKDISVDYVIDISANLDNDKHVYLYPAILSSHDAHCYYSTLVKPSAETVEAFKAHIRSGAAARGKDLHQHPVVK